MAKVIHVNRQNIAYNRKVGKNVLPVYTMKRTPSAKAEYAFGIEIKGPSRLIDPRDQAQLKCGAVAWIETDADVELIEPMTWEEVKKAKKKP